MQVGNVGGGGGGGGGGWHVNRLQLVGCKPCTLLSAIVQSTIFLPWPALDSILYCIRVRVQCTVRVQFTVQYTRTCTVRVQYTVQYTSTCTVHCHLADFALTSANCYLNHVAHPWIRTAVCLS